MSERPSPPTDVIEVWQQRPGLWRWMFRAGGNHTEILSNETYRSLQEALGSARIAYPGVPVAGHERPRASVWPSVAAGFVAVVATGLITWAVLRSLERRRSVR
jgi:hypothetical protein